MKLVLGTVQFGLNYGINNFKGKPSSNEINNIFHIAYDNGIRLLDTAEVYGNAHNLIGKFHKEFPLKKFNIITKIPDVKIENFENKIKHYLSTLNVDFLDTILFHSYKSYILNNSLLKEFKNLTSHINKVGVSIYTNNEFNEVIKNNDINVIQLPFNLFDNINKRGELLQKAKDFNKVIQVRSVFLQGLFFMDPNDLSNKNIDLSKELYQIIDISNRSKIKLKDIALNYCVFQKNIDHVLIGVDNEKQLLDNLSSLKVSIDPKVYDEIDEINIINECYLNPSTWI